MFKNMIVPFVFLVVAIGVFVYIDIFIEKKSNVKSIEKSSNINMPTSLWMEIPLIKLIYYSDGKYVDESNRELLRTLINNIITSINVSQELGDKNLIIKEDNGCLRVFNREENCYYFCFDYINHAGCVNGCIPITVNQAMYMLNPETKTATLYGPCFGFPVSDLCQTVSVVELDGIQYEVTDITENMRSHHTHKKLKIHALSNSPLVNLAFDGFDVVIDE